MTTFRATVLLAATLTTGLMAGLYAAFSYSVMPGFGRGDDRTFVQGMQNINQAILNGWFGVCFGGAVLLTGLAVGLTLGPEHRSVRPWLIAALVLYVLTLVVTFAVNVPLNDELVAAGPVDRIADLAAVRERFEATWVRWNVVRSVVCLAAFGCLSWALVLYGRVQESI